jgi:nicotinate-nucleotide pyrophosphorylase (carboxylating)
MPDSNQNRDYPQIRWDEQLEHHLRQLVRLAVLEDLDRGQDWTSLILVDADTQGEATLVTRQAGIVAGLKGIDVLLNEMNADVQWQPVSQDAANVEAGSRLGALSGSARDLLVVERPLLNFIGRLSGIASLTGRYVAQLEGHSTRIYDTRKTTPGWRRLEKYAVRCGGGFNHRMGLFGGILVKDNHLAITGRNKQQLADLVPDMRKALAAEADQDRLPDDLLVEVEVDSLDQLRQVLPAGADIVLLDNMSDQELHEAVQLRDQLSPATQLEASGGITLERLIGIAECGIDRISVGALTHSATALDIGLDWIQ